MGVVVTTAPTAEPVTLEEVRAQTRLEDNGDDGLLLGQLIAARAHIETLCSYLMPQTVAWTIYDWPATGTPIPFRARSVTSIAYTDSTGATVTLSAAAYIIREVYGVLRIYPAYGYSWPTLGNDGVVTITTAAGYSDADAVPAAVRFAIMVLTASWFADREGGAVPDAVDRLVASHRWYASA